MERDGREVLYVPGKLVATVKAGTGKRKARTVACGNFLNREKTQGSPTLSKSDIFAAGLDSLALRAQVAAAAWWQWQGATVDIKTAFLTAPLQAKRSRRVVTSPSKNTCDCRHRSRRVSVLDGEGAVWLSGVASGLGCRKGWQTSELEMEWYQGRGLWLATGPIRPFYLAHQGGSKGTVRRADKRLARSVCGRSLADG